MATRRQYGTTWWGAAWLAALEKVDDANRLPRGKSYANTGRVEQLSLAADRPGCIEAFVSGSVYYPYEVTVGMKPISARDAKRLTASIAADPDLVASLMDGELPHGIADLCRELDIELFPRSWRSMQLSCSCPDSARVCKHLAAVFYVMADRIDIDPFFIFRFRGLDLKAEMRKCGIDVDRAVKVKPLDASEILSVSAALMSEKESTYAAESTPSNEKAPVPLTSGSAADAALQRLRSLPYAELEPLGETILKLIPKTSAISNNPNCTAFTRQVMRQAEREARNAIAEAFLLESSLSQGIDERMEAEAADEEQSSGTPLLTPKAAWSAFADPFFHAEGSGRKAAQQAWEKASAEIKTRTLPKLTLAANNLSFVIGLELPAASSRSQPKFVPVDLSEFFYALFTSLSRREAQALSPEIECWRETAAAAAHLLENGALIPAAVSTEALKDPAPRIWWIPALRSKPVRQLVNALAQGIAPWADRMVECDAALGPDGEIDPKRAAVLLLSAAFSGFINRGVLGWKAFKGPSDIFEAAAACCSLDQLDGKVMPSAGEALARMLKPFALGDAYPWRPVLTVRSAKKDCFAVNFGILGRCADLHKAAENELSRPLSADDLPENTSPEDIPNIPSSPDMPPAAPDSEALFREANAAAGRASSDSLSAGSKEPQLPMDRPVLLRTLLSNPVWANHRFAALTILKTIAQAFPVLDGIRKRKGKPASLPMEDLKDFLFDIAPHLSMLGITLMLPQAMRNLLRPKLVGAAAANIDFMKSPLGRDALAAFDWNAAVGGRLLSKDEFQALAGKAGQIVQIGDDFVYLDPDEINRIKKTLENPPPMTALERMRAVITGEFEGAEIEVSNDVKEGLKRITEVTDVKPPEGLQATLRPYQARGYSWLMKNTKLGLGSLIADDMGLGKTLQVISAVLELKNTGELKKKKVLAILPTTLIANWTRELTKFAPTVTFGVYHGADRQLPAGADMPDVLLTSYGTLRRDYDLLSALKWRLLIIDEAQAVKNPGTAQTAAVRGIKAQQVIAMTGTPVENRLMEFWSILSTVQPKLLGSMKEFADVFARPIEADHDERAAEAFRRLTAPFMLRRVKTDKSIIADLPEKNTIDHFAQMHLEQAVLYQETLDRMLKQIMEAEKSPENNTPAGRMARRGRVLKLITSLKQICNSPSQFLKTSSLTPDSGKGDALLEILSQCADTDRKVLIFTQYREMGERLQDWIAQALGERPDFLHGGVSAEERMKMVDRFQADRTVRSFILSLKAGGTGLNLTAASAVIHYDLWWNPAVEAQATDRAFRIGQRRDVLVYRFITAGSFEERINDMLMQKRDLADMTVAAGENWIGDLSTSELAAVFKLG